MFSSLKFITSENSRPIILTGFAHVSKPGVIFYREIQYVICNPTKKPEV